MYWGKNLAEVKAWKPLSGVKPLTHHTLHWSSAAYLWLWSSQEKMEALSWICTNNGRCQYWKCKWGWQSYLWLQECLTNITSYCNQMPPWIPAEITPTWGHYCLMVKWLRHMLIYCILYTWISCYTAVFCLTNKHHTGAFLMQQWLSTSTASNF